MVSIELERVSKQEQKRRVETLLEISNQKLSDFYALEKGREATVLWEGKCERQKNGTSLMSGWTENYVRVSALFEAEKINCFSKVII